MQALFYFTSCTKLMVKKAFIKSYLISCSGPFAGITSKVLSKGRSLLIFGSSLNEFFIQAFTCFGPQFLEFLDPGDQVTPAG